MPERDLDVDSGEHRTEGRGRRHDSEAASKDRSTCTPALDFQNHLSKTKIKGEAFLREGNVWPY